MSAAWLDSGADLGRFEDLPQATCLLDETGRVLKLNRAFREYLDEHDYIQDAHPGVLISCIHAVKPGMCGRARHCGECVLRNAINSCVRSGEAVTKARMLVQREDGGGEAMLLISVNRVALQDHPRLVLSFEDITDLEHRPICPSAIS